MNGRRGRPQMAVRAAPPPARDGRRRTAVLLITVVLGVLLATIAIVVGLGRPAVTASPSPSGLSLGTAPPSATATASGPASTGTSGLPTSTDQPTPIASRAEPSVTPAPTAVPTALTDAPMREVVFTSLGIDNPVAPEATERRLTFNVDGRGEISAEVQDITAGLVQVCLWPGDGSTEPATDDCIVTPETRIERTPELSGRWTLLLAGAQPGRSPSLTLLLRFPANDARLDLADFRFQGQNSPSYAGFVAKLTALADGQMDVTTTWDDGLGGSYPYILSILDLSVEFEEPVAVEGTGYAAAASRTTTAEHTYEITMTNLQESIVDAVFLRATFTWP